ncbi:unnamed protein product [Spirodela intermedia]|uniref:Uncharacterized protein n=1 Tax=Spirodela intermedia TaxID=51605 RepID=A0A7I8IA26_SPIIN|nr:unnamed protein product [Spirodela intermedia]CAA6654567.1 unnamed protein product [Spirodela intermedia]
MDGVVGWREGSLRSSRRRKRGGSAASLGVGGGKMRAGEGPRAPEPRAWDVIVGSLCFANNTPSLWKFLDQAIASGLLSPLHTLALLTSRVIPNRQNQPEAYRLYLELISQYGVSFSAREFTTQREKSRKALAFFFCTVITKLVDCTLEDLGLQLTYLEKAHSCNVYLVNEDHHANGKINDKRHEYRQQLFTNVNILVRNRPEMFRCLLQRFQFIEIQKSKSPNLLCINDILVKLYANICKAVDGKFWLNKRQATIGLDDLASQLTKTLQVVNQASWQETFQALWISALRLVQRERESIEGPVPHLDARLCVLLSIAPLAIDSVMKDEVGMQSTMRSDATIEMEPDCKDNYGENQFSNIKHGLISSIQLLRQFTGLLSPPPSVVMAANNAARKAASFISNFKNGTSSGNNIDRNDTSAEAVGNMIHLIVEACIARKLIDTSVYFWSGYVVLSPWLKFMEGAQLTNSLTNALVVTPASTVTEVKKLYNIALNGSDDERAAATKILCGASLSRGWNIQEHVMNFVIKLLSAPLPSDISGQGGQFSGYISMINPLLLVFVVPDVAAALVPLCEVFGSMPSTSSYRSSSGEEMSVYSIFSCAFLFLLRLWKFYRPPQEHCVAGRWGTVRTEVTLDYLLLMYNNRRATNDSDAMDIDSEITDPCSRSPVKPVYIGSFPKLRAWYFQNQACIAATISGFSAGNPVHQVANKILNMICRKMTTLSGSPINSGEDAYQRPTLPAWQIMESLPFVLEALLAACAHGRLSSRELTTGLRDLVDFFPASLATIISYFSSEITRGIWKPVEMNGIDWPSPVANLISIEAEIKDVLASAGVHVPTCYAGGNTAVILPLPMAALISLTITFKLDPSLEYINGVAGPALENCAASCSSPCMPIVGALWAQKVRRWHDFIIMSCARSPFERDQVAIRQLLRSCFTSFLGCALGSGGNLTCRGGVDGLLGHAISPQGASHRVPPFYDPYFVSGEILKLVVDSTRQLARGWACSGGPPRNNSLAEAAAVAKQVATLGASLLCIAGGPLLVQVLYRETIPTWLLSAPESGADPAGFASHVLEGNVLAQMLFLSGSFVWGIGGNSTLWEPSAALRGQTIQSHSEFVAGEMEGDFSLGCHPATWKAYVSCWLRLLVQFAPSWVHAVKPDTLRKLASGLRAWREGDLALSLLERGGPGAVSSVVESIL